MIAADLANMRQGRRYDADSIDAYDRRVIEQRPCQRRFGVALREVEIGGGELDDHLGEAVAVVEGADVAASDAGGAAFEFERGMVYGAAEGQAWQRWQRVGRPR